MKSIKIPFPLTYLRFSQIQFDPVSNLSPPSIDPIARDTGKLFNPSSSSIFAHRIRECSHRVSASMIIPRASDEVSNISKIHPPSPSFSPSLSLSHPIERGARRKDGGMKILAVRSRGYVRAICKSRLRNFHSGAGVDNDVELLTGRSQGRDTFQLN